MADHAEDEPEDRADDDESIEVDVDASEVKQVVPVKISNIRTCIHTKTAASRACAVWVRLQYNAGSKTNGFVRSAPLGDSEEGLGLLRAYTKRKAGQKVRKYMPWVKH